LVTTVVFAALATTGPVPVAFASNSLSTAPGQRPGPSLLYRAPAISPQLTNAPGSPWQAAPILVSAASAYRGGEYLYQDFLYDDHGANGTNRDPNDPRVAGDLFSAPNGTYTYPTGPGYNGNAADLVEIRVKPIPGGTAFRVTLNTLVDPALAAFTIAIGTASSASAVYPHGAQSHGPADLFVTVHNSYADLVAAGGTTATALPAPSIDMTRRQVEVRVPQGAWNPGLSTVRLSVGVGLWDRASGDSVNGKYLVPASGATATSPGGLGVLSGTAASALFNAGFRHAEPGGATDTDPLGVGDKRWWRESAQGTALETGDMSGFHDDVDFNKLANAVNDDMNTLPQGVPLTGAMDRILSSHFETEQGVDYGTTCGGNDTCKGELRGQLQPYAVYIPTKPRPAGGYGLTLLLHSLSANYNQYINSKNQSEFGERGPGSIVITPAGRGPDGWYVDYAGADTFEVWADIASRYPLDPGYTAITGYSMGGHGTFRFGSMYPDLFYKAQPTVGPPGVGIWVPPTDPTGGSRASNTFYQLASFRNVPIMMWAMHSDELVPFPGTEYQAHMGFDALGLRYQFWVFAPGDHLTLAANDEFQPAADWLGTGQVDPNPPHVSYVANPKMAFPALGLEVDHAYWLSGITLRDGSGASPLGTIDVRSEGFGVGDPTPSGTQLGGGALSGGRLPAIAYEEQSQSWGAAPAAPVADKLDINAGNVSAVTIDVARARVDCNVALNITSDGPLHVSFTGCARTVDYVPGAKPTLLPNTSRGGLPWSGTAVILALLVPAMVGLRRRARTA
jgi:hypothetical protein